jgi:spore coat polysaccharide biosynthesis predicted glycosyltransferase SpsG
MTLRVGYVCRGGGALGWGHLGRGGALLAAAPQGGEILFGGELRQIRSWRATSGYEGEASLWASPELPFAPEAIRHEAYVVDDYSVQASWLAAVDEQVPVFLVDDWMRRAASVPALICPNIGAARDDYPDVSARTWFLGAEYTLLRPGVLNARDTWRGSGGERPEVLVTLGGSDPGAVILQIVETLGASDWFRGGGRLTIVLGGSYAGPLPTIAPPHAERLELVHAPADFLARCAAADLVVCGASTTTYELAYMGVPFIPLAIVNNQSRITKGWARAGVGAGLDVRNIDWPKGLAVLVAHLALAAEERKALCARARTYVDGGGAGRIVEALIQACRART